MRQCTHLVKAEQPRSLANAWSSPHRELLVLETMHIPTQFSNSILDTAAGRRPKRARAATPLISSVSISVLLSLLITTNSNQRAFGDELRCPTRRREGSVWALVGRHGATKPAGR